MARRIDKTDLSNQTQAKQQANERRLLENETNELYKERNRLVARLNRDGTLGVKSAERLNSILEQIVENEKKINKERTSSLASAKDLESLQTKIGKRIGEIAKSGEAFSNIQIKTLGQTRVISRHIEAQYKDQEKFKKHSQGVLDIGKEIVSAAADESTTLEEIENLRSKHAALEEKIQKQKGGATAEDLKLLSVTGTLLSQKEAELEVIEKSTKEQEAADKITGGMVTKYLQLKALTKSISKMLGLSAAHATGLLITFKALTATGSTIKKNIESWGEKFAEIADAFGAQEIDRLAQNFAAADIELVKIGADAGTARETFQQITDNFGVGTTEALKLTKLMGETAVLFGMTNQEAADIVGILHDIGGFSEDQVKDFSQTAMHFSKLNNIAPARIMKEIQKSSDSIAVLWDGTAESLIKTTAQAAKFGMALSDVEAIQSSMLDFQDSIQKEMMASIALEKDFNFQNVRDLFMAKKPDEAMAALRQELERTGVVWSDLDPLEKGFIADAAVGGDINRLQKLMAQTVEETTLLEDLQAQWNKDIVPGETLTNMQKMRQLWDSISEVMTASVGPAFDKFLSIILPVVGGITKMITFIEKTIGLAPVLTGLMVSLSIAFGALAIAGLKAAAGAMISAIGFIWKSLGLGSLLGALFTGPGAAIAAVAIGAGLVTSMMSSYNRASNAVQAVGDMSSDDASQFLIQPKAGGPAMAPMAGDKLRVSPNAGGLEGDNMQGFNMIVNAINGQNNHLRQLKEENQSLKRDMASYFGTGGSVARNIGKEHASRKREGLV